MTALLYTFAGLGIFWTALLVGFGAVWWLASRAVERDDAARERLSDDVIDGPDLRGLPTLDACELAALVFPAQIERGAL
jgi:hypothetical protein